MVITIKEAISILNANVVACERAGFDSTTVKMIEDALDTIEDALKAQEPVKPIIDIRHGKSMWRCGSCATALQPNQIYTKFCFNCGKAVKWE